MSKSENRVLETALEAVQPRLVIDERIAKVETLEAATADIQHLIRDDESNRLAYAYHLGGLLEKVKASGWFAGKFNEYVETLHSITPKCGRNYRDLYKAVSKLKVDWEKLQVLGTSKCIELAKADLLGERSWRTKAEKLSVAALKAAIQKKNSNEGDDAGDEGGGGEKGGAGAFRVSAKSTANDVAKAILAHRPDAGEIVAALQKLIAAQ